MTEGPLEAGRALPKDSSELYSGRQCHKFVSVGFSAFLLLLLLLFYFQQRSSKQTNTSVNFSFNDAQAVFPDICLKCSMRSAHSSPLINYFRTTVKAPTPFLLPTFSIHFLYPYLFIPGEFFFFFLRNTLIILPMIKLRLVMKL